MPFTPLPDLAQRLLYFLRGLKGLSGVSPRAVEVVYTSNCGPVANSNAPGGHGGDDGYDDGRDALARAPPVF